MKARPHLAGSQPGLAATGPFEPCRPSCPVTHQPLSAIVRLSCSLASYRARSWSFHRRRPLAPGSRAHARTLFARAQGEQSLDSIAAQRKCALCYLLWTTPVPFDGPSFLSCRLAWTPPWPERPALAHDGPRISYWMPATGCTLPYACACGASHSLSSVC